MTSLATLHSLPGNRGSEVQILSPRPFDIQSAVVGYLGDLELGRKASTASRARQILIEYQPFASGDAVASAKQYLWHCKANGNSAHTLDNKLIRLRSFYKTLGVPLDIPRFRYAVPKPEAYTQVELDGLFAHAQQDLPLFKTLLQAGLRKQEAMFLRHEDLLDTGIRVIAHGGWTPKTNEERTVSVPRSLIDMLRGLPRVPGSNLVFPTATGKPDFHMLRSLKRCAVRAGIDPERCWLHKFRINFATTLLRHHMPLPDVMAQLGHVSSKSTLRYLALLGKEDKQSMVEEIWK